MQPPKKRPATQVPPPKTGKAATSRQPAVQGIHKSPTTRMPQEPAPRSTTRSMPRRAAAPKKNSLPLILGIAGGALLLIIIVAIAASGTKKPVEASNKKAPAKGVDVTQLERDGMRKCDEGVVHIQRAFDISDKAGLQRGVALITEGNQLLDQAYQMSGNRYDTKKYNETLKMARGKLLELK